MKVVLNQEIEGKINKEGKTFRITFERFLIKSAAVTIVLLVAIQASLFNPFIKACLTGGSRLEGEVLNEEAYLFVPAKMELKLMNLENCPDLDILVNGEKRDSFQGNSVMLELKEGDIVELDAGSVLVEAIVQVSAVSSNISEFLGKTMTVTDGINPVAEIKPAR